MNKKGLREGGVHRPNVEAEPRAGPPGAQNRIRQTGRARAEPEPEEPVAMTTKHEVPQNPARETVEEARAAKRSSVFAIARRLVSLRVVALFGLAAIAGAMVAMGCGSSGSVGAQSDATQKPVA